MFMLKEAKENIEFATYYRQLTKATADCDVDTPGYIYEDLYNLSQLYPQYNGQLVDFLISKLLNAGWYAKRKAVVILLKLCKRGQEDLCCCLCKRDGDLRKAISLSGQRGSINANPLQRDTNALLQELMQVIFSSEKERSEQKEARIEDKSKIVGYGSSNTSSRYDGFGSAQENTGPGLFDKFSQSFMNLFSTEEKRLQKERSMEDLLKPEPHQFKPLTQLSHNLQASTCIANRTDNKLDKKMSASSSRTKVHKPGRPGGGWASDDEDSIKPSVEHYKKVDSSPKSDEEEENKFLQNVISEYYKWPIKNYQKFYSACKSVSELNIPVFCKLVHRQLEMYCKKMESFENDDYDKLMVLLLLIENTINLSIYPIPEARFRLLELMQNISQLATKERVKDKAEKLSWVIEKLYELHSDAFGNALAQ